MHFSEVRLLYTVVGLFVLNRSTFTKPSSEVLLRCMSTDRGLSHVRQESAGPVGLANDLARGGADRALEGSGARQPACFQRHDGGGH